MTISLDHLHQLAYSAYSGTSFSPERRADSIVKDYTEELNGDLRTIETAAPVDMPTHEKEAIQRRYAAKYESLLKSWLYSHSNVISSFIAGPSNFPGARMQKRSQWADNHYNHFRVWRTRALKAILKGLKPKVNELDQAREKLQRRAKWQRLMVAANEIIRKGGPTARDQLAGLGLSTGEIARLLIPDRVTQMGFKRYQLSNNNAEIRRLRQRVQALEEKQRMAETTGSTTEEIKGVRLIQNYEADRVQIIFPDRPSKETCQALRKAGFVWSPTAKAWQRKLTPQAASIGRTLLVQL